MLSSVQLHVRQHFNILKAAGGDSIRYIGPSGQGMSMKLACNGLLGIQVAALAEILGMLSKSGIRIAEAIEHLGNLPVMSPVAMRIECV